MRRTRRSGSRPRDSAHHSQFLAAPSTEEALPSSSCADVAVSRATRPSLLTVAFIAVMRGGLHCFAASCRPSVHKRRARRREAPVTAAAESGAHECRGREPTCCVDARATPMA